MTRLLVLLLLSLVSCNPWAPRMDPLSPEWAVFVHNNPGGRKGASAEEQEKARLEAVSLVRHDQYWDAAPDKRLPDRARIERAISLYADGEIYYAYGDALLNAAAYQEAIQAFQIALSLDTKSPELALYSIAVCHGYLGRAEEAVGYLKLAANRGFHAKARVAADPAFSRIRNAAAFQKEFGSAKPVVAMNMAGIPPIVTVNGVERASDFVYSICPNGRVYSADYDYIKSGTWERKGENIQITWHEFCRVKQTGEKKELLCRRDVLGLFEARERDPFAHHYSEKELELNISGVGIAHNFGSGFWHVVVRAMAALRPRPYCSGEYTIDSIEKYDAIANSMPQYSVSEGSYTFDWRWQ